jgi:hypothetical protein
MAEHRHEFLKAPEENLRTWNMLWRLMIYSGAVTLVVLLILGLVFV